MQRSEDPIWIEGDGIVLREWRTSDVPSLVTLYDTSEMHRRTPVASPFNEQAARDYVASAHELRREVLAFPAAENGGVELAYAVVASHMGQGLARRAVSAVLTTLAKMGAVRAHLLIADDKLPSPNRALDRPLG